MVQIGDIHIGKAQSAVPPNIDILEASLLWDAVAGRYKCMEETQVYHKYAHDAEFKAMLKVGLTFLENQTNDLEKQMERFQLPMPIRPPKQVNDPDGANIVLSDRFMFNRIFEGCQGFIDFFARITRSVITNDHLRDIFANLLKDEIALFDKMCKFGKLKGWLDVPPLYKAH